MIRRQVEEKFHDTKDNGLRLLTAIGFAKRKTTKKKISISDGYCDDFGISNKSCSHKQNLICLKKKIKKRITNTRQKRPPTMVWSLSR